MPDTAIVPQPTADVDALIQQARRRQRRRYAAIGAAAVLLATLGAFAGLHGAGGHGQASQPGAKARHAAGPRPPGPIPGSVDTTVLMWPAGQGQDGTVALDNLRTGQRGQAATVADPGENQPVMLVSGWIVHAGSSSVRATSVRTGKTRVLGSTLAFAPSATPGDLWLEYGYYGAGTAAVTVRSVPVASGRPGPPVTLPRGTQLVAGTGAGLLLERHFAGTRGPLWLWTPGTAPRELPGSSTAEGFAVSQKLIAYGSGCADFSTSPDLSYEGDFGYSACRILRVFDTGTGRLRSFAAPPGTAGWAPAHGGNWAWSFTEIAPSGRLMAAEAVVRPASKGIARVFLLHLSGPDPRVAAVPSSAAFLASVTAWSPGSSWLFYQGPGQRLWAYQVSTGHTRSSAINCCQYAVMAAIASPSG